MTTTDGNSFLRALWKGEDIPTRRWTDILMFWGLVLLAFVLRAVGSATQGLSDDEPFTVWHAQMSFSEIRAAFRGGNHPPTFEMLVHVWGWMFGDSVFALRLIPVTFGALTAGFIYLCGRDVFSRRAGLVAALLFAAGERQIYYAHEVRSYTLLLLFTMITCWCLLQWIKKGRWQWLGLCTVLHVMLIYTHYFGFAVIAVQGIWALFSVPAPKIRNRLLLLGSLGIVFLAFLPFLGSLQSSAGTASSEHWVPEAGIKNLIYAAARLLNSLTMAIVGLGVMLASIVLWLKRRKKGAQVDYRGVILLLAIFPVTYLLFWLAGNRIPIFLGRYILFTSGALLLLTSGALGNLVRGRWRTLTEAVYLIAFVASTNLWPRHHDNWPAVADDLTHYTAEGGAVLFLPGWGYLGTAYYMDREAFRDYAHTMERMHYDHVFPYLAASPTPFDASEWDHVLILRNGSFKTELNDSLAAILEAEFRVDSVTKPYHSVEMTWLSRGSK